MHTITVHSQTKSQGFSKQLPAKLRVAMASAIGFVAGPPMSERAGVQYAITDFAITDAQVRKDKEIAAVWAQYPLQGSV